MKPCRLWTSLMLAAGILCVSTATLKAASITVFSDAFATGILGESLTTVDSAFHTIGGTNVDLFGNIGTIPSILASVSGICASSGSANCVDLDGTTTVGPNPNTQGILESAAQVLAAGTYTVSYDLLGSSGYLSTATSQRNVTTLTAIEFGTSGCIAAPSALNCLYYNPSLSLTATDVVDGNITSGPLTVSAGTYYIAFVSGTSGLIGALVDSASIAQLTPEPSTGILLGSALLGLGALARARARRQ